MSEHSIYSPSASLRNLACLASWQVEQRYENKSSPAAQRGTSLHRVLELALNDLEKAKRYIGLTIKDTLIDRDMTNEVQEVIDYLYQVADEDENSVIYTEQRVDIDGVVDGMFGTIDIIIFQPGYERLIVLDYKSGRIEVSPTSSQLTLYAIGALGLFESKYAISEVVVGVLQPCIGNIGTEAEITYSADIVEVFRMEMEAHYAHPIYHDKNYTLQVTDYTPGGVQCKYCRANADCAPLATAMLEACATEREGYIAQGIKDPLALSNEEVGGLLGMKGAVSDFFKAIEERANKEIREGKEVPGWKLTYGNRGARVFIDEEAAVTVLKKSMRLIDPMIYTQKLKSPTQIEKILTKQRYKRLESNIKRRDRAIKLVPEKEKGDSIVFDDFESYED